MVIHPILCVVIGLSHFNDVLRHKNGKQMFSQSDIYLEAVPCSQIKCWKSHVFLFIQLIDISATFWPLPIPSHPFFSRAHWVFGLRTSWLKRNWVSRRKDPATAWQLFVVMIQSFLRRIYGHLLRSLHTGERELLILQNARNKSQVDIAIWRPEVWL